MQDLGALSGDVASVSISINDAGVVVGTSLDVKFNPRAFLWKGGVMTDLNTLIAGHSPLYLLTGCSINSRGEITGLGLTSTGEIHTYLATPKPRDGGESAALATQTRNSQSASVVLPENVREHLRQQLRFGRFGVALMGRQ